MTSSSQSECHRYLDLWALPGIHPTNIQFLQKLKSADTNHFTRGMDVVGTISELDNEDRWEKTHLIGVRTDVWRPDQKELAATLAILKRQRTQDLKKSIKRRGRLNDKQTEVLESQQDADAVLQMETGDLEKRRLVLKLFKSNTQRVRWSGTIEEVTSTEIHNSIGSRRNLLTLVATLPTNSCVTYIQENHRTLRFPAVFTCGFYDAGRMYHVQIRQRWFSLGPDFDILIDGKHIGLLDGKVMSFGSDSYLDLEDHPLVEDTGFVDLLTLFGASIGYHKAMRRSINRRVKAVLAGESHRHVIEDEELRLRQNGRAAA